MTIDELVYDLLRKNPAVKDLTTDAANATASTDFDIVVSEVRAFEIRLDDSIAEDLLPRLQLCDHGVERQRTGGGHWSRIGFLGRRRRRLILFARLFGRLRVGGGDHYAQHRGNDRHR